MSALWPRRVLALFSGNSYNIQDIAHAMEPASPSEEAAFWYQYYFHSERGRRGLTKDRRGIARLLWRMWSPTWGSDQATFERTAPAFDNSDFVEVVIHSYRHRYGLVSGDPAYAPIEAALAKPPPITVPSITIDGDADGVNPGAAHHPEKFARTHEHRVFRGAGHNLPQERPEAFAHAVLDARDGANMSVPLGPFAPLAGRRCREAPDEGRRKRPTVGPAAHPDPLPASGARVHIAAPRSSDLKLPLPPRSGDSMSSISAMVSRLGFASGSNSTKRSTSCPVARFRSGSSR